MYGELEMVALTVRCFVYWLALFPELALPALLPVGGDLDLSGGGSSLACF